MVLSGLVLSGLLAHVSGHANGVLGCARGLGAKLMLPAGEHVLPIATPGLLQLSPWPHGRYSRGSGVVVALVVM